MLELLPLPSDGETEVRVLSAEEISSVESIFHEAGVELPDPATSFVVGAVRQGVVKAFLVIQLRVHAEPMWISPGNERFFSRVVHEAERTIASRAGTCDVFLFAPAGKVAALASAAGLRLEPWVVYSKRVEGVKVEETKAPEEADPVPPVPPVPPMVPVPSELSEREMIQ